MIKYDKYDITNPISIEDIKDQISKCKPNKAPGIDGITNEVLKDSNHEMLIFYKTLFNKILELGKYPANWNRSLTQLIYKDGSRDNPENFRGITLTSNLSKIFNGILNSRIRNYLEKNTLIAKEQGGFRKDFRTTDHILVLQTIVQKYLSKGKKVYSCFIDLKKAFDSIDRNSLIKKLDKIGFGQKTIKLLMDMYRDTYTSIIFRNKLLPKIRTLKGLKQGDILSPILFIIFINDLPKFLKEGSGADSVELQGTYFNSLLWADDIILLSESAVGLQNCINNLCEYCRKWDLEINIKKTKSLIFNKNGKRLNNSSFKMDSLKIENVNSYSYLGFNISSSGKFNRGIETLLNKAQRAWFVILKFLNKSRDKKIDTYLTLFDNIVKPILLYACEIWGYAEVKQDLFSIGKSSIERFHLKVCKQILGVHRKASNIAVLAELGRFPLKLDIQKTITKYLLRFNILDKDRLVYKAYIEELKNPGIRKNWINFSKNMLDENGLSYIFLNHINCESTSKQVIDKTIETLKIRNEDIFKQTIMHHIHNSSIMDSGKLSFYGKLKENFGKEMYLNINNFNNRKTLSELRMSAHKLEIEKGRYLNINRNERICKNCKLGVVEDEAHFILECPVYSEHREGFYRYMCHEMEIDLKYSGLQGIKEIFLQNDINRMNKLAVFIRDLWEKRNSLAS